ncbi:hypothetical protein H0S70_07215 [Chryseobacterium manosquense]|uniref:DNA-binding protein n=1 Tax=Chryseobacterium manosquense TaxID=2754694 RepID=A0A7H1DT87_9FLAO|nr:hypothetical protein [Chryseobacterium manosquense]QNS40195.1 hypothetical protein H0S70_07215 [Chryseobacterium manosquense]
MNEILKRRCADLTVLEILTVAHLKNKVEKPFIDMASFCEVSGMDRNRIHKLLINDLSDVRSLVWGGYEKHQQFAKNKKLYFDTEKVLEWLKNRK